MAQMVGEDKKSSLLVFGTYALCIGCQLTRLSPSAKKCVTSNVDVMEDDDVSFSMDDDLVGIG
jgi:hypothetical protein